MTDFETMQLSSPRSHWGTEKTLIIGTVTVWRRGKRRLLHEWTRKIQLRRCWREL